MNLFFWKAASVVAVGCAILAIWMNGEDIERLEGQVCDTIAVNIEALPTIDYYKMPEHKDELDAALQAARDTQKRFHCKVVEND